VRGLDRVEASSNGEGGTSNPTWLRRRRTAASEHRGTSGFTQHDFGVHPTRLRQTASEGSGPAGRQQQFTCEASSDSGEGGAGSRPPSILAVRNARRRFWQHPPPSRHRVGSRLDHDSNGRRFRPNGQLPARRRSRPTASPCLGGEASSTGRRSLPSGQLQAHQLTIGHLRGGAASRSGRRSLPDPSPSAAARQSTTCKVAHERHRQPYSLTGDNRESRQGDNKEGAPPPSMLQAFNSLLYGTSMLGCEIRNIYT
jgi:hypothetical protein